MKITIMSRLEAIQYTYSIHKHKFAIISISESNGNKPFFLKTDNFVDCLYLFFDDVVKDDLIINPMYKIMKTQDALDIKQFVDKVKDNIDELIIHCHAGVSRSSAIACSICKYLNIDDLWIWTANMYSPNKWCLNVMNNTLELGFTKDDFAYREKLSKEAWDNYEFKNEIESMFVR